MSDLLLSFGGRSYAEADDRPFVTFDERVIEAAFVDAQAILQAATPLLGHAEARVRWAAAHALGRATEGAPDADVVTRAEALLVERLSVETDEEVVDSLATGLLHAWSSRGDSEHRTALAFAADLDRRRRLAGAKSLALATPTPLPPEVEVALRRLQGDADDRIRFWADLGLGEADNS